MSDQIFDSLEKEQAKPHRQRHAGFWLRYLAYYYDYLLLGFFITLIVTVLMLAGMLSFAAIMPSIDPSNLSGFATTASIVVVLLFLIPFTLSLAYNFILEIRYGATVGKMLLGIKVRNDDGSIVSKNAAIKRNIFKLLPAFLPPIVIVLIGAVAGAGIGAGILAAIISVVGFLAWMIFFAYAYLRVAFSMHKQAWHDIKADTIVTIEPNTTTMRKIAVVIAIFLHILFIFGPMVLGSSSVETKSKPNITFSFDEPSSNFSMDDDEDLDSLHDSLDSFEMKLEKIQEEVDQDIKQIHEIDKKPKSDVPVLNNDSYTGENPTVKYSVSTDAPVHPDPVAQEFLNNLKEIDSGLVHKKKRSEPSVKQRLKEESSVSGSIRLGSQSIQIHDAIVRSDDGIVKIYLYSTELSDTRKEEYISNLLGLQRTALMHFFLKLNKASCNIGNYKGRLIHRKKGITADVKDQVSDSSGAFNFDCDSIHKKRLIGQFKGRDSVISSGRKLPISWDITLDEQIF